MTQGNPAPARTLAARLIDCRLAFMRWRRRLKATSPYVRRRVHRKLEARYAELAAALCVAPEPADACGIVVAKALKGARGSDLCLFVTYAPQPRLKSHVVRHVEALKAAGVMVVLIVNTPLPPERLEIDPGFRDSLAGLYVRANVGFDFAAWAHVILLAGDRIADCARLILTNDSVVGPLRGGQLVGLMERIRLSSADVLGLTENVEPRPHLQSFFLVFQRSALESAGFAQFWRGVRILPTKDLVIALYEANLTGRLSGQGLRCEPLFRLSGPATAAVNDVYFRWAELIESGFPFVKTSVLETFWGSRAVRQLVPREILDGYEFANSRRLGDTPRKGGISSAAERDGQRTEPC